jgi:hypothetical protein
MLPTRLWRVGGESRLFYQTSGRSASVWSTIGP